MQLRHVVIVTVLVLGGFLVPVVAWQEHPQVFLADADFPFAILLIAVGTQAVP